MSRRPKGGMGGARKKVGKQEPLVSEAWGTLATTTISMLETVGAINEEANEDCIEEAAQLAELNKKRMGIQDRLQLLDTVNQMVEGFLGAFADMDDEGREEHGVAELFENLYGSMFTLITESVEGINKDGVADEAKEQLQQQLCMLLRLIDTVMAVSFENDEDSALTYFKPFAGVLFELCCTQLCLGTQYDFFVRSMALGLLTDQIEGKHLTSFLLDPVNRNIVELIIDTCFKLCADEKDAAREAGEEDEEEEKKKSMMPGGDDTSQNLGTQLLDTLTSVLVSESGEHVAATIILQRSTAVLSKADATPLDTKAALICLAVVPEAANDFAKSAAYLDPVMAFLQKFSCAPHDALVRSGAFIALSEHLEHLQPAIESYHPAVLASIVTVLGDSLETSSYLVKNKACLPLHILVKASEKLPVEYLQPASDKNLVRFLLDQIKPFAAKPVADLTKDDYDLLGELITTVSDLANSYSTAVQEGNLPAAVGQYFEPFVTESFELLLSVSQRSTADDAWMVRGQAAAGSAQVAALMAQDALLEKMPTLSALLTSCMEAEPEVQEGEPMPEEIFTVRSSMHATWSALANKLQDKVEPFVDAQVPFICRALADGYGAADEEEPDEEDEEQPEQSENQARDAERSYALECYRDLAKVLGPKFLPHQDRCFAVVTENYTTYSSEVQAQVVELVARLPTSLYPIEAEARMLTAGVDLVLPEGLAELLKQSKNVLLDYVQHATDSEVVESALDYLSEFLDFYGQVVVNDDAATMIAFEKITASIMKMDAPCQTIDPNEIAYVDGDMGFGAGGFGGFQGEDGEDEEEDEEEEEEEEEDEDEEGDHVHGDNCNHGPHGHDDESENQGSLLDSLFGALSSLAKAKGASFKPTLDAIWPRILKLRKKKEFEGAISGFFADIGEALGDELFADYRAQVMPLLLADINNAKASAALLRNSAYAIGQIFLRGTPESTQQYYGEAVTGLLSAVKIVQGEIDASEEKDLTGQYGDLLGAKDNVIAAIGRLLMVGAAQLPVAELIPTFVAGLPLQNDFSENQPTYSAVAKLVATLPALHPGVLEAQYPSLLRTLATVAATQGEAQKVSLKLKAFIVKSARTILAAQPNLRAEVIDQLDAEVKAEFVKQLEAPAAEE